MHLVKYKTISLGLALALLLMGVTSAAKAQPSTGDGFKISPVKEELTLNKGEVKKLKLYVTNINSAEVTASAQVYNGGATGEDGNFGIDLDGKNQYANNFKSIISPIPNFGLAPTGQPGDKKELEVTVTIPENANPGAYIGAIRISSDKGQQPGQQVNITGSVATIYLINVAGNIREQASLVSFSAASLNGTVATPGKLLVSPKKVALVTRIKNSGNSYIKPYGKVQVYKGSKVVYEYEFNDKHKAPVLVLPGQTRMFTDELQNINLGMGKYSVVANLSYGTGGNIITAKTTYYIVPAWLLGVLAATLVAVIFAAVYFFTKRQPKTRPIKRR